jgi:short-subunit dehydrogenase
MRERSLAVVTGASSGIGRAFAEQLAASGHDLVLVARSRDRLEALAAQLRERDGVEVRTAVADLADSRAVTDIAESLRAAPPDLLVNNAGVGTAGAFHELDVEREEAMLHVNILALVRLTHACLPGMLVRGSGAIVNVSSLAGEVPSGYNATYGASKAFVTSFSQALYEELRDTPIAVQCLLPGLTDTAWAETAGLDMGSGSVPIADPADVARASLAALANGSAICIPGKTNRILALIQRVMPRSLMRRVTAKATRGALAKSVD